MLFVPSNMLNLKLSKCKVNAILYIQEERARHSNCTYIKKRRRDNYCTSWKCINQRTLPTLASERRSLDNTIRERLRVCLDSVKDEVESVSGLDDSLEERRPTLREKYLYDLVSLDGYTNLKEFAGLQLIEETEGDASGEIKLSFNIVFSPSKPLR